MKKVLVAVGLFALAVGAFGVTQSLGTAGEFGYTRDVSGGISAPDMAYVYARFQMTGITFNIVNNGTCLGDEATAATTKDVWVLTALTSNADVAMLPDKRFIVENTGGLALDLAMNVSDVSITTGDAWDYATATEDISYALNKFRLFGIFVHEGAIYADEAAVKTEIGVAANNWIVDGAGPTWYKADGAADKYNPATGGNEVYVGKDNLNLPAACNATLSDYCQLLLRINVGEGASDQYYHAAQVKLVSRITNG